MYKFQKNDHVVYAKSGVCLISDIKPLFFNGANDKDLYYILTPLSNNNGSVIYIPCNNETLVSKMQNILTAEEIDNLLESTKGKEIEWIDNRNQRATHFHSIASSANREDMLLLINCLYKKHLDKVAKGKKLSTSDENILKNSAHLIEEEFAFSLHLSNDEVKEYIKTKLGLSSTAQ